MISKRGIEKIIEKKVWVHISESNTPELTGVEEAARIIHGAVQHSLNADGAICAVCREEERNVATVCLECLNHIAPHVS